MALDLKYFTDLDKESPAYKKAVRFLIKLIRNPDPGSNFEKRTQDIRKLSDNQIIEVLLKNNYDALICFEDGRPVGMEAFQTNSKENSINFFGLFVNEEKRGFNIALIMAKKTLEDSIRKGFRVIRKGAGGHEIARKIISRVVSEVRRKFPSHEIVHRGMGKITVRRRL